MNKTMVVALAIAAAIFAGVGMFFAGSSQASTPESCEQAFEVMDDILEGPLGDLVDVGITSTGLIPQAFDAGLYEDVASAERVISTMDASLDKLDRAGSKAEDLRSDYDDLVKECLG